MNRPSLQIRPAVEADWPRIHEICCLTGNVGKPIDRARWKFFGELWVGPYQRLCPEWTWVAAEESVGGEPGRVQGYITGCPATRPFERRKRWCFTPGLFARVLIGAFPRNNDTRRYLRRTLGVDPSVESRFSKESHETLSRSYPAHLHVNLDEPARGGGAGRRLLEAYFAELRSRGIPGVHLFCGASPVPFYEKTGFRTLEKIEFAPGIPIFAMVQSLK